MFCLCRLSQLLCFSDISAIPAAAAIPRITAAVTASDVPGLGAGFAVSVSEVMPKLQLSAASALF